MSILKKISFFLLLNKCVTRSVKGKVKERRNSRSNLY